jgi:hypothetical protein
MAVVVCRRLRSGLMALLELTDGEGRDLERSEPRRERVLARLLHGGEVLGRLFSRPASSDRIDV